MLRSICSSTFSQPAVHPLNFFHSQNYYYYYFELVKYDYNWLFVNFCVNVFWSDPPITSSSPSPPRLPCHQLPIAFQVGVGLQQFLLRPLLELSLTLSYAWSHRRCESLCANTLSCEENPVYSNFPHTLASIIFLFRSAWMRMASTGHLNCKGPRKRWRKPPDSISMQEQRVCTPQKLPACRSTTCTNGDPGQRRVGSFKHS